MSEEKSVFNGNLALLRVCAIILIVNVLNIIINMLFALVRGGILSALWNASFEDIIATAGLIFASGWDWIGSSGFAGGPIAVLLGLLFYALVEIVIPLGLGIFALVKKNVMALKIAAILVVALGFVGPFTLRSVGGVNFIGIIASLFFNINIVVAVATFFIQSKKHVEEINNGEIVERFNFGLYRFCAVCFILYGLNGAARMISGPSVYVPSLFSVVAMLGGILALVKKNVETLMICSLIMLVENFLMLFQFSFMGNFVGNIRSFMIAHAIVHFVFNTTIVVCVATFFIEPERTKRYLQKIKRS